MSIGGVNMLDRDELQKLEDKNLLNLLRVGNVQAFNLLYDRYSPVLYVHACRMLKDVDLAKDVVHDLFAMLWHKKEQLLIDSNLKSYLYRAVRNRVLDLFAKEKVRIDYQNYMMISNEHDGADENHFHKQELEEIIESELNKLPEQMRKVFLLSRLEDKSYKEIAADLDIAEGTVKKQIYLALKRLKKSIVYILIFFIFS
ncbi:RNA polymerase sigma factor [Sphingobacterium chuzhouense]|uniref:RNA polymerase sigma-70 factor n=1 Tax=Sphingobacterium chuzhouense TaxID=1742264 RepID=A0ABR7XRA9_9SPHI|nr:RNA polymerase sigma-70 factor [Sphingobacterium chuzhouense]MBD1420812.1 RNA polymerase sigma-70 factor [Sphingobacterium chuzhouense]